MKDGKRGAFVITSNGGRNNQQLTKDCGIIPYLLYKNHGFRSVMVGAGKFEPEQSCRAVQKYLSAKWHVPVDLIRNGWYNFPKVSFDKLFEQKENIILTVGRLGTDQKRNQDLMEAFAKVSADLPDWSLRLVGNIREEFKPYMENYFATHPALKERVIFTGIIEDKIELANEFKRAKIFCLTSTYESAPNVAAEALFGGDFIITSAVDAASDMIDDNKCGRVFPVGNVDALANIFREVCKNDELILAGGKHAVEYARRNYSRRKNFERNFP